MWDVEHNQKKIWASVLYVIKRMDILHGREAKKIPFSEMLWSCEFYFDITCIEISCLKIYIQLRK
jgi:hypothetical protein